MTRALGRSHAERPQVPVIDRNEFLVDYWDYSAGEHVTLLGPTGSGKTTLAYQLLDESTDKDLQGVVLVMKPRDRTVDEFNRALKYRKVAEWPPSRVRELFAKPRGYTVWPKHTFEPDQDDAHLRAVLRRAMLDSYRQGNRVLFCDEVVGLAEELRLKREINALHMRGRSMGTGLWASSQRPYYAPVSSYSQASHLFIAHSPDKRDRDRFRDIGGVNPYMVAEITAGLDKYHWLYIRRDGPHMCVVSP